MVKKINNKNGSIYNNDNNNNNKNNNNNNNEFLTHILKQLRPFQREAYDFAVKGLSYQRQYNNNNNNNNSKDSSCNSNNNNANANGSAARWISTNKNNNDNGNGNANGFSAGGWIKTKKSSSTSTSTTTTTTTTTTTATTSSYNANNTNNIDRNSNSNSNNLLLGKGRILLADEMGLGKTITSLAIMTHYYPYDWPLLILCPASLKYTWPNEIEKFIPSLNPSSIYVIKGFDDVDFYYYNEHRPKIQIVIASFSLLQNRSAAARCLQQFQFKSVIVDESHNLKQPKSQRTRLALPLLKQAKRLILLSGTPALARPVELWTQISIIAPKLFATSYTQYTLKYCNARRGRFGWDVSGISNSNELHSKLKQIMVRRKKVDVLHELPAKQRSIIPITISTTNNGHNKKCQSIIKELSETRRSIDELIGEQANSAHFEARKLLMKAYQASGMAKVTGVCEYLLEWLRNSLSTQKVLIFAHHRDVLDKIENVISKEYKGIGHIRIDGTVPSQERAVRVKKFQTNPQIRVAVLSMTAAGVGLTLTAASTVMFAELHWTPGILAQAEDRCHRIGQRNAVNILYLICQDPNMSIDLSLWCMLGKKIGNLGKVIDGNSNAYLNAELKEDDEGNGNGVRTGQQSKSVQDEIQEFFAETSSSQKQNNISSNTTTTPVKGSIMSFFQKQKQKQASSSSSEEKKKKNTTAASSLYAQLQTSSSKSPPSTTSSSGISKLAYANNCGINHPTDNIKTSPYFASSSSSSNKNRHHHHHEEEEKEEEYEWACEACTYINTKKLLGTTRKTSLVCDICGRSHTPRLSSSSSEIQQQNHEKDQHHSRPNPSPTVTPTTNRNTIRNNGVNRMKQKGRFPNKASNHDIVVLDDDDDDDDDVLVSSPEQTKLLSNTQSSSPASETEPIVIDPPIIATTTMKKINSSREDPIELLDTIDDDNSSYSPVSKKAKPSSCIKRRPPPSICSSHDDDLIVIDEDDGPSSTSRTNRTSSSSSLSSKNRNLSVVLLKGHKPNTGSADSTTPTTTEKSQSNLPITKAMPPAASPVADLLAFSVSRNSGRITLHYAVTGKSSLTNFELEQILSDECSGKIMEAQITRKSASSKTLGMTIEFKYDAIDRVVRALDHSEFPDDHPVVKNGKAKTTQQLKKEIQDFVQNYLQLREVEKKAIRDSECHFVSSELKRAVLRIMASSSSAGTSNTTERYAGGARERSRQRMADNIADETDLAILEGRLCAWCGGSIPTVFQAKGVDGGTYCGRECAERGRLNTSSGIRQQIFALEGGKCRLCGIDAFALYTRIISLQPAERLNALCNVNWKLPKSAKALDKLLLNPKEGDFWEADHIHAVSEGGGSCGIDNIRTLCVPCHQEETSKLNHRLKLNGGPAVSTTNSSAANNNTSDEGNNKRQRDIRDMFKPVASHQKNNSKRFRGVKWIMRENQTK